MKYNVKIYHGNTVYIFRKDVPVGCILQNETDIPPYFIGWDGWVIGRMPEIERNVLERFIKEGVVAFEKNFPFGIMKGKVALQRGVKTIDPATESLKSILMISVK